MFSNGKLAFYLSLAVLAFFLAPEIFYWVALDNFQAPLRDISGDSSLYASQLNAVLKHGQPTGNPYFIENQYQLGRFFMFGSLFSFIPLASKIPIVWWLIIFKVAVALLAFWLLARLMALFNTPPRLSYLLAFIFVLFYGAITFKGGSALYNWYLPAWLGGLFLTIRFYQNPRANPKTLLSILLATLLFSFHPVYFFVGVTVIGLLWLHLLYEKFNRQSLALFLVWLLTAGILFSTVFLPFFYSSDPAFSTVARDMAFRNTLLHTRFPFLFLFGLRFLILTAISALVYFRFLKSESWKRAGFALFVLALVAFLGLNSYVITGRYFLNDHFPFFEEFIVIPLGLIMLLGSGPNSERRYKLFGWFVLLVTSVSVLVIWNYLNFKPIYFGAEGPQYLAYLVIGLLLLAPSLREKLFFKHGRFLLKSLLALAIFHIIFMTFWDDKYWLPRHRQVEEYRGLIEELSELPAGVILANPYISNLALVHTQHKVYWSPIAFHDLVSTDELRGRWLGAKIFFPAEPSFNGQKAVVSIFGRRDNKCREFRRGFYLGLLSRIGFDGPRKAICDDPILVSKWPELEAAADENFEKALKGSWQPTFQLNYLIVEKDKDVPAGQIVSRYFKMIGENERFSFYSYRKAGE